MSDILREANEKCGIFGVYAPGFDVARITYFGLYALQHRGQESAGIAISNGNDIIYWRNMGLITQVFDESILQILKGHIAIGHTRYSTTGSSIKQNAQPLVYNSRQRKLAVGHNGNLINAKELKGILTDLGIHTHTTSDTEMIGLLLDHFYQDMEIEDAVVELCKLIRGAYCLVILTEDKLLAVRDPYGIRPLCLGQLTQRDGNAEGEYYVVASESCALPLVGAQFIREIPPGEFVVISGLGRNSTGGPRTLNLFGKEFSTTAKVESYPLPAQGKPSLCMFEFFYFARPDSILNGKEIYQARVRMGRELARESQVPADLVISVPDSGVPAAIGYAQESGIPYGEGMIKNRYVGRTFIDPLQVERDINVSIKFNPLREVLDGKRVVLVDDSIVRGSTSKQLVRILKSAGAKEVHFRLSSPPIKYPCYYGIDFGDPRELVANSLSVDEIRRLIGADSLHYLSIEGLIKACQLPRESFCLACFTDDYPIPQTKQMEIGKFIFET